MAPQRPDAETAFTESLKALRTAWSMTQAHLADEMSSRGFRWHPATVYKVENGERQVQLAEAVEIARIFDTVVEAMTERNHERVVLGTYQRELWNAQEAAVSALGDVENARKVLAAEISKEWILQYISEEELKEYERLAKPEPGIVEPVMSAHAALREWIELNGPGVRRSLKRLSDKLDERPPDVESAT